MARVLLDGVTKRYGDVTAVDSVDLEVADGEFLTLVGPSGCGKSTTLEMVAGLTIPTDGQVVIGDRDVTRLPPKDRGIAMVFQNIALFPHMDVYDNMSFGLRLRSFPRAEIDRRVERAADILQIGGLLDRMPDELSGGQRQRVAIGRAIVRQPAVFLMDEPLANLDAKLRVHMRTELQRLHRELQTTVIYVTHDQAEAMTMSDRIAVMSEGSIQQVAPPLACYNRPANLFVAEFIGSPSMNTVPAAVGDGVLETPHFDVEFDPATVEGVGVGDRVTLGIRPEDIYLERDAGGLSDPTAPVSARTDVLEPMGDEIFVYLLTGDRQGVTVDEGDPDQLLMSVPPDSEVESDRDVRVVLDRSKLHLFDAETGRALAHGLAPRAAGDVPGGPADAPGDPADEASTTGGGPADEAGRTTDGGGDGEG